ncbi:transcriptional regulator, MarR family [Bellilinea caldifistulae]|uniref:MarR family transcriptional regulator n=1 Tax=Bellilinea caldifistulae TaxID=360411 RepID=A0A0P6XXL4_9CHLR|nr:MarR family transcriptional regulator [Bellilinea caldifistulae]KPL78127.1 MarR family transcriptional regulator [Bellilinea caldifistulae]GAP09223.1 transcriptional regulator, MarR family [Bellilinea caldifistulae]
MPTHYQGDPQIASALDVWVKLTRAVDSIASRLSARGTTGSLTITQFGVLEVLYHLGPMPQCELAGKLLKSSGNITLVVDNLEKRGLVRRVADEHDRRISRVELTPAGLALIEEIFPKHAQAVAEEFSVLTPQEQHQLGDLLRKLGKRGG